MQCRICREDFQRISNHIKRTHGQEYEDYLIRYVHGGERPKCACGCGEDSPFTRSQGMSFKKYIHGHHAAGRKLSKTAKQKIGRKNRKAMKQYWAEQTEETKQKKHQQLMTGRTPEVEARRVQATRDTYAAMTYEDKQKFRDHTSKLWEEQRPMMMEARLKGAKVYNKRYANGEFDFTERNRKVSETITRMYEEGGFAWAQGLYHSKKGMTRGGTMGMPEPVPYRSSYELLWMQRFDADSSVKWWAYEPITLRYDFEGKNKPYLPDFFVIYPNGRCILVEVKNEGTCNLPRNEAKYEAAAVWAKENGIEFEVWAGKPGNVKKLKLV